ncbi:MULTISPECIES: 2-hydroxymuconate tautomerase [unclassified Sedimentibacter]|uniref:2-hydroxymuconate tautomerase n=1 Tax=unclassified Sedimentibacter TaxID=2649220 RepID=UPI0027DF9EEE|nr:2-hydroxymuconate tautomerase [Sedimentibacter sp. MB35-C1]WMJ76948.1 2-hydroxymuconate tautomerase [Sedimentibacter sp. MB35-C1]
MPIIQVNLVEGRILEQKEKLIRKMTDVVSEVLSCPTSTIRIMINEMKSEHLGIDGESMRIRRLKNNS